MKARKISYILIIVVMAVAVLIGTALTRSRRSAKEKERAPIAADKVPVSEAFDIENVISKEYDNLVFSTDLSIETIDSLDKVTVIVPDYSEYNSDNNTEIFDALVKAIGYEGPYNRDEIYYDTYHYPVGPVYEYKDENIEFALSIGCTGFFSVFKNTFDSQKTIKQYFLAENYENDSYELINGTMTISEAEEMVNSIADEIIGILGYNMELKASRLKVCENEEGGLFFEVILKESYNGIDIINILDSKSLPEDTYKQREGGSIRITGESIEDVEEIIFSDGALEIYGDEQELIEIFSLSSAADKLNELLAEYRSYNVKAVNLEYMPLDKGNEQTNGVEDITKIPEHMAIVEEGKLFYHRLAAPWAKYCSYDILEMQPCWAFYLDVKSEYNEVVAYVNCETGEVKFVNNR